MYRGHTVGVVVPAHNEEKLIGTVLETVPPFVDRVYVINDGSTDDTWAEITRHAEHLNEEHQSSTDGTLTGTNGDIAFDSWIVPICHERNRGVGGAIKTGYTTALNDKIDITAVMAGDAQMEPNVLSWLLDPIVEGQADYTKANRLLSREFRQGMSTWRFFGNSILSLLTKIASGYWKTMDPQNGYTAISNEALTAIDVQGLYEYYGYCNHLLVKLNAREMRVADVAIPAIYGTEQSGIMYPKYIQKVSLMLLSSFLWRLKARYLVSDFHPLALFYYLGAITTTSGMFAGLWVLYTKITRDEPLFLNGISSLVLSILGWLFILFAMIFDMEINQDKEVQIGQESLTTDVEPDGASEQ